MADLKVGDTVVLKSGGPAMTVTAVKNTDGGLKAWCSWFDASEKENTGSWPVEALEADE